MAQGFAKGITIDTDPTLAANSDLVVPSQKAVKTYIDLGTAAGVILAPASSTRNRIDPTGDFTALVLRADAAQAQPIFTLEDSGGTAQASFGPAFHFRAPSGNAAAPGLSFHGDTDTGIANTANALQLVTGAAIRFRVSAQLAAEGDGSAATPAFSFTNNTNMGLYRAANNVLGVGVAGIEVSRFHSTGLSVFSSGAVGAVERFRVGTPTTTDAQATAIMSADNVSRHALILQAAPWSNPAANIFECQDSTGSIGFSVASFNTANSSPIAVVTYPTFRGLDVNGPGLGALNASYAAITLGGSGNKLINFSTGTVVSFNQPESFNFVRNFLGPVVQIGQTSGHAASMSVYGLTTTTNLVLQLRHMAAGTGDMIQMQTSASVVVAGFTSGGFLYFGPAASASGTGFIRLPNTGAINWRNAANSGNIVGITVDASDAVSIAGGEVQVYASGTNVVDVNSRLRIGTNAGLGSATQLAVTVSSMLASTNVEMQATADANVLLALKTFSATATADLQRFYTSGGVVLSSVDVAGRFLSPLGALATVGQGFQGDPNTGLYSPGADAFSLVAGGTAYVDLTTARLIVNEGGADFDVRMEGDTDVNLFFLDASTDRIGIGTAAPGVKLDVNGTLNATAYQVGGAAGASGTFTTTDLKTVTVVNGIVTSIV
jgi:hypothetical protein